MKKRGLGDLFEHYASELQAFLRHRRGRHDAEDLVQDSFVRLIEHGGEQPLDNPRAWLYRTSANLAADAYDYQQVRTGLQGEWDSAEQVEDDCADPARINAGRQQLHCVWRALLKLPEPCRQAFLLNRLDGMSQREIAVHLGISEKTVERHVLRALQACLEAVERKP